ncbi:MAG: exosortase/archaeosortase family protein [Phycisphaerae bacterium]|nr:exosortase/archaeosortase family protein [Phycisphaerae bacterium]
MSDVATRSIDARPRWTEFVPPLARVRVAIVVLLLALVYWPTVRHLMVARWIHDADWSHGWLIPVFSGYFLYAHRDELRRVILRGSAAGAVVLALSLAAFFTSAWWGRWGYIQAITVVSSIFGVTLLMGGWQLIRVTWFPILFLALAVPLPERIYVQLTFPLREFASWAAAAILPLLIPGLHTEAQAVVIDYVLPGRAPGQLNVEEACAGMRLMMAFVTLGIAMAYLGDRPGWQRLIMVLCCVPIAVFCNVVRVTATGLLHINGYETLAKGTPHQLMGIAMLVLALGMYLALGWLLSRLFIEESSTEPEAPSA